MLTADATGRLLPPVLWWLYGFTFWGKKKTKPALKGIPGPQFPQKQGDKVPLPLYWWQVRTALLISAMLQSCRTRQIKGWALRQSSLSVSLTVQCLATIMKTQRCAKAAGVLKLLYHLGSHLNRTDWWTLPFLFFHLKRSPPLLLPIMYRPCGKAIAITGILRK